MKYDISINTHSSIRIAGSKILYFDPFKIEGSAHDADFIFVTHEHFDHFEPDSIAKVKNEKTFLVAPESMKNQILKESGVEDKNCVFLKPGVIKEKGSFMVQAVPAYNKQKLFHQKNKQWLGYIVHLDQNVYYVAGDTDCLDELKKIKCDVALVPVGGNYTMDAAAAAELVLAMKPAYAIPTHYGSVAGSAEDGKNFKSLVEKTNRDIKVETIL